MLGSKGVACGKLLLAACGFWVPVLLSVFSVLLACTAAKLYGLLLSTWNVSNPEWRLVGFMLDLTCTVLPVQAARGTT